MKNKLILLSLVLISTIAQGQQSKTFFVVDKQNGKPIPYSTICIQNINTKTKEYTIANENGKVEVSSSGIVELSISSVGYKSYKKTVDLSVLNKVKLETDIFALNQVVVTGQNRPMLRDSSIYSIKVFDSKLIQQRGAINLADVLKAQPSIKINQSGTFGTNINILGLGGENVKIMIDGVPIIGRLDGKLDLSQITMENVDHIEVIEGPMSVIYGSNALAGTINIITKNNKWNKLEVNANTYIESPGTINTNLYTSIKKANNIFTLSGARNYFSGTSYEDSRASKWKGSEQYIAEMKYSRQREKYTFSTTTKYFNEFMKDKGAVFGEGSPTPYAFDINFYTKRYNLNGFLDIEHKKTMQTNIQSSISYFDRVMQTVRKDMTDLSEIPISNDTTTFLNFMTRATFNHTINAKLSYQTGIDLNTEQGSAKRIIGGTKNIGDYAIFITNKYQLHSKIIMQTGLRYAYNTKFTSPLLYSINLKLNLNNNLQARVSFAKGFRSPTLKEMYLDFSHAGYNIKGNPDLQPEYSHSLNGSIEYTYRHNDAFLFKTELKAYYNNIIDKIGFALVDRTENTETWMDMNKGNVETLGWIADITLNINTHWNFNTNYTRSGITNLNFENDNSSNKFFYTDNFLASLSYTNPKYDLSTRIEYSFRGKEAIDYLEEGNLSLYFVDSYNDLNISLTKSVWEKRINISIGAKNLFDNTDLPIIESLTSGDYSITQDKQLLSWGRSYFIKINLILYKH
ncbi:MAG: TonB-dependent receptor [Bacteroidales bacterium]|nr:TonB-dependent receptor [Bacteroidales bacterium]